MTPASFPNRPPEATVEQPAILFERRKFFFSVSYLITLTLFGIYVAGYLSLITKLGINRFIFPFALILAVITFHITVRSRLSRKTELQIMALVAGLFLFSIITSILIFDTSWDGQWYHEFAILKLSRGWNPYYLPFYSPDKPGLNSYLWIQHYPKASWICQAVIYKCTGFIESGKCINQLVAFAVFFNCYSVVCDYIKKEFWCLIFCVTIALNPVVICQLFSHMVDGMLASFLILIILALFALERENIGFRRHLWAMIAFSIIMVSNLKFTGLGISGLIILVFSFYWIIKYHSILIYFRRAFLLILLYCLAFFAFGFNPYLTNLEAKHFVFYPLNNATITRFDENTPVLLTHKNNLEKLFISICSIANNDMLTAHFFWKNPLIVYQSEIRVFSTSDVRLSGFGPLFQLIFWLSIILLIWNITRFAHFPDPFLIVIPIAAILFTTLISPVGWMARFTPQFYYLPFLVVLWGLGSGSEKKAWGISKFILLICGVNCLLILGSSYTASAIKTSLIRRQLDTLASYKLPVPVYFDNSEFQSERIRLQEAKVNYIEKDTLTGTVHVFRMAYRFHKEFPEYTIPEIPKSGR
jgi:hypothetical protein